MDLSGPKAFAESLTPQSKSAVGDVDFGLFSSAVALSLTLLSGLTPSGAQSDTVDVPTLPEGTIRSGNKNNHFHIPPHSTLCGIEGKDGEG